MKCGIADVGSNTIRLSLYQWSEDGRFRLLFSKKETAGLAGYIQDGVLAEAGIEAACRALSGFRALLDNLEIPALHAFATAPLRNVSNGQEARAAIEGRTGLRVEVLSGADEAALSFLGASREGGRPSGLLTDIGGGSTELASYRDGAVTAGCSLPVGSLSLYAKFVEGLFPTGAERKAIRSAVERTLGQDRAALFRGGHLIGVGGTVRAAARLCSAQEGAEPDERRIPARAIRALYRQLKEGDKGALRQILRFAPDRVHTLIPGLIILTTVIRTCGVETVCVSTSGVREGYLLDRVMRAAP